MRSAFSRNIARAVAWILAAILSSSCGYHFASSGSALPSSANSIYVARFKNKSRVTGVDAELDRSIKDEIARHDRLALADAADQADLELTGTVRAVEEFPAAYNPVVEPLVYNQMLVIDAQLTERKTRKVLWSVRGLSSQVQFAVVPQAVVPTSSQFLQGNLRARDVALLPDEQLAATQRASSRDQTLANIAHDLYAGMSEGF